MYSNSQFPSFLRDQGRGFTIVECKFCFLLYVKSVYDFNLAYIKSLLKSVFKICCIILVVLMPFCLSVLDKLLRVCDVVISWCAV